MEMLLAPWREKFILGKKQKGCIFCQRVKQKKDKENLILYRGEKAFIIMNRFPYNSGHLMVVPYRHIRSLEKLDADELGELMKLTQLSVLALKKVMKPQGFNLGMNLEKVSGAGVSGHLHIHIVPRWTGDTNFMPILGKTKVLSIDLKQTYLKLKKAFENLK